MYQYEMVEIPQSVAAKFGKGDGVVGPYLRDLVKTYADAGWEFYRIDTFRIVESAGCGCLSFFLILLQQPTEREFNRHVVTFRAPSARADKPPIVRGGA